MAVSVWHEIKGKYTIRENLSGVGVLRWWLVRQQAVPVMEVIASQQLLGSWHGVSRGGTVVLKLVVG